MCVLLAEHVSVHDFLHFPALPEMMSVLCSKDSWYPSFTWLPWYLIGTNYPECVGHFPVKCSGRSRRLTLHQSREVFSVKSSDYRERRSHLGKIKRFSLFAGFSLFSPFYSGKWFPDSGKVSVSLNETSSIFFFFLHYLSRCACVRSDLVKASDLLSVPGEITLSSMFFLYFFSFNYSSCPTLILSFLSVWTWSFISHCAPLTLFLHLSSFSSLLDCIWFKLPKATVKMQWLQHH